MAVLEGSSLQPRSTRCSVLCVYLVLCKLQQAELALPPIDLSVELHFCLRGQSSRRLPEEVQVCLCLKIRAEMWGTSGRHFGCANSWNV